MSNILVVVEGNVTEPKYLRQFQEFHRELFSKKGNQSTLIIIQSYGTLIYDLYKELNLEGIDSEEFDTIPVLIEILRNKNREVNPILIENPDSFSDIYLIFDLDAHYYHNRSDRTNQVESKISEMLSFFNESTDKGKLLISYPMIEAIRCFDDSYIKLNQSKIIIQSFPIYEMKESRRSQTTFKSLVSQFTPEESKYLKPDYDFIKVVQLINYFRVVCIFLKLSSADSINSEMIFNKQLEQYIKPYDKIIVLSAFPQFMLDLFGEKRIAEVAEKNFMHFSKDDSYDFILKDLSIDEFKDGSSPNSADGSNL